MAPTGFGEPGSGQQSEPESVGTEEKGRIWGAQARLSSWFRLPVSGNAIHAAQSAASLAVMLSQERSK